VAAPLKFFSRDSDTGTWLMVAVFTAVLVSLYLLGNSADNLERFGRVNDYLLIIDAILTLVVFWMVAVNAWRLFGDLRSGRRSTARWFSAERQSAMKSGRFSAVRPRSADALRKSKPRNWCPR